MKPPKVCPGCRGKGIFRHYSEDIDVPCDICEGDGKLHPEKFTCHYCADQDKCWAAWDMYNTDGDCLGIK